MIRRSRAVRSIRRGSLSWRQSCCAMSPSKGIRIYGLDREWGTGEEVVESGIK